MRATVAGQVRIGQCYTIRVDCFLVSGVRILGDLFRHLADSVVFGADRLRIGPAKVVNRLRRPACVIEFKSPTMSFAGSIVSNTRPLIS